MRSVRLALALLLALHSFASLRADDYVRGKVAGPLVCKAHPENTYAYYLPNAFDANRKWPVLFVFDARKRGAFSAELFRDAAETYGWIVASSNDTQSDVDPGPSSRAIQAMWRDVQERFPIDPKRVYAAGFSGGAMFGWWFVKGTKSAGLIGVGGRLAQPNDADAIGFDYYGLAGSTDFNYIETRRIEQKLAKIGANRRVEFFEGRHGWAPPEYLRRAVEWHELQAMRHGTRARDETLIATLFASDVEEAAAMSDDLLRLRRYEAIARTFDGLTKIDDVLAQVARLQASPEVKRLRAEYEKAEKFEAAHRARISGILQEFFNADPVKPAAWLANRLSVPMLLETAKERTYRGLAAQRVLSSMYVNLSFYLPRELRTKNRSEQLEVVLTVANRIKPPGY